ncbi:peptidase inhibitor R3HDML [Phaethornis superciliosus]
MATDTGTGTARAPYRVTPRAPATPPPPPRPPVTAGQRAGGRPLLVRSWHWEEEGHHRHDSFCRYCSVVGMVKSWHQEKEHNSFPHPHKCNPCCSSKCSSSVCSHYTQGRTTDPWHLAAHQMVWASSSRLGCALATCANVQMWGSTWQHTVPLICNYAIKGNWLAEAPYKVGRPCSACPPTYSKGCSNNICFTGLKSNQVRWI